MNYLNLEFREQTLFELFKAPSTSELDEALKLALSNINDKILKTKGDWTKKRLNQLFALIASEINPAYDKLFQDLPQDATKASEIVYAALGFETLPKKVISEIVNSNRLVQGYQFKDLIKTTKDNHVRQIKRIIGAGVSEGLSSEKIIKDINEKDLKLRKYQLNNVVYTYISESRAISRYDGYRRLEQLNIIKGYEYVATLDGRTTEYCRDHDGRKYYKNIEEIQNKINVHFHCRSVFAPINTYPDTKRASQFGEVDGNITYRDWFDLQDDKFKRTILGKKKFEAYKKGKYDVNGLSDVRGKTLTLTLDQIEDNIVPNSKNL